MDTFTETSTVPHQAVAANYLGCQGPRAIPETVQQHPLDAVVTSSSGNGKSKKRGISECLTVYCFAVIPLIRVMCFLVGRQGVRHGGSGDQHLSLREYGGMRNYCFKLTRAVSEMYEIQEVNYFC